VNYKLEEAVVVYFKEVLGQMWDIKLQTPHIAIKSMYSNSSLETGLYEHKTNTQSESYPARDLDL
jgi:hypothetical protein